MYWLSIKRLAVIVAVVAVMLFAAGFWGMRNPGERPVPVRVSGGVPMVIPTTGGRLEISSLTVYERFTRESPPVRLGWFDVPLLGTTKSMLQLKTVYRYYVPMEKQWVIERFPGYWLVRSHQIEPTLPVSYDSRDLELFTQSGWARFDKQDNLVAMLKSVTPQLEQRAQSDNYKHLAREAGRPVIAGFVRQWLLKNNHTTGASKDKVIVLFPGESLDQQD